MHRHQLTTFDQLRIAARLVDASRIQSGLEQLRVMMRHFDELTGPQRYAVSVWAVAQSVDSVRRAMRVNR